MLTSTGTPVGIFVGDAVRLVVVVWVALGVVEETADAAGVSVGVVDDVDEGVGEGVGVAVVGVTVVEAVPPSCATIEGVAVC